ncbi:snaclec convulxin subunit beta-like [Coregonus clupeaformis]|uniref:snaclec convulxin subunit beta-like n=1 Tax=Coregonus clupeaformis TaxID=59861 RepID=UPI001E1C44A3|nr:snaclec convulxin subunit beta-like [Coregonus clupeaformis]
MVMKSIKTPPVPLISPDNKLTLVQENKTWDEALEYCRQNHVDLVSVHSQKIQDCVQQRASRASTVHVWLGLRYPCTLDFWFWVSGVGSGYQEWAPGHGFRSEECGKTGAVQRDNDCQLVARPETDKLNFICTDSKDAPKDDVCVDLEPVVVRWDSCKTSHSTLASQYIYIGKHLHINCYA